MATKKLPDDGLALVEITSCNTISTACQSYYTNVIPHGYPTSLEDLLP
ncbi:MAG: hypothetical protein ABH847_00360 [Candidatus Omnitrophota bacterium]